MFIVFTGWEQVMADRRNWNNDRDHEDKSSEQHNPLGQEDLNKYNEISWDKPIPQEKDEDDKG